MHNFKIFSEFVDGIKEIYELVPNARPYLKDENGEFFTEPDKLVFHLMDFIKEEFPVTRVSSYSLSICATEVGFKTKYSVSFGWKPQYGGGYSFRVSVFDFLTDPKFTYTEGDISVCGSNIIRKAGDIEGIENISSILKSNGWVNTKSVRSNPFVYGNTNRKKPYYRKKFYNKNRRYHNYNNYNKEEKEEE